MMKPRLFMLPLLLLLACGEPPAGNGVLHLGWTFVDGRRCADSGVERVVLTPPGELTLLLEADCPVGFGTTDLRLGLTKGKHELELTGLSAAETPLYRGSLHVNMHPNIAVDRLVDLRFTGGL